jgi:hypothetical protein
VKVSRLKKSVAGVILLLVFTMGGFALSLAHDDAPLGFSYTLELRLGLPTGAWQRDGYPVRFGLASEVGAISSFIQQVTEGSRNFSTAAPSVHRHSLAYPRPHAPKISLHMLDSILLI